MHPILFSQKKAYLASLAQQREWLRGFGITPARYEMLVVIAETNKWLRGVHFAHQSEVRRQLGVTAATVSKMLKALEKLGFVSRMRSIARDRRQVIIDLTRKARDVLKRVKKVWIEPGYIWLAVSSIFGMKTRDEGMFTVYLDWVREKFRDKATFLYPWFYPDQRRQDALTASTGAGSG